MWETEKLRLPEGGVFAGDMQNYLGTQVELLRSDELAHQALKRLLASGQMPCQGTRTGMMIQAQISGRAIAQKLDCGGRSDRHGQRIFAGLS